MKTFTIVLTRTVRRTAQVTAPDAEAAWRAYKATAVPDAWEIGDDVAMRIKDDALRESGTIDGLPVGEEP